MKIQQLSIFIENRSGRLKNIATTLGDFNINIRAMSLADNKEFGILRLIVDETEKARELLKDHGFAVRLGQVIAVEIEDRPGALGSLLTVLESAALNVEYMYAFVQKNTDRAVMILKTDDLDRAIGALTAGSIRLLDNAALSRL
jgi:hypothetical protein